MTGLCLLSVYVLGEFALAPTALCRMAEASGEHQVLLRGDTVVLHHPQGKETPHHGITPWLVSLAHRDASGDHVLCCTGIDACEEPRVSDRVDDPSDAFDPTSAAIAWDKVLAEISPPQQLHHLNEDLASAMALADWCTVRLMI